MKGLNFSKIFLLFLSAIASLGSAGPSIPQPNAVPSFGFVGQGFPRRSTDDCLRAGKAMAEKLAAAGAIVGEPVCAEGTQDGYQPKVEGTAPVKVTFNSKTSPRFPTLGGCENYRNLILNQVRSNDLIELGQCEVVIESDPAAPGQPSKILYQIWYTAVSADSPI